MPWASNLILFYFILFTSSTYTCCSDLQLSCTHNFEKYLSFCLLVVGQLIAQKTPMNNQRIFVFICGTEESIPATLSMVNKIDISTFG
jgi:hypothetical protein